MHWSYIFSQKGVDENESTTANVKEEEEEERLLFKLSSTFWTFGNKAFLLDADGFQTETSIELVVCTWMMY